MKNVFITGGTGYMRLGLVTLKQMINALIDAVENPAQGIRVVEVPEIRRLRPAETQ